MSTQFTGQHENRTRVICHLPLNNSAQERAVQNVIGYLESQRKKRIGVEGYTYSEPNAFHGRWWSSGSKAWVGDSVVLLIVDYNISLTAKKFSLSEQIGQLKASIQEAYRQLKVPQEEVWVISYPVTRHA